MGPESTLRRVSRFIRLTRVASSEAEKGNDRQRACQHGDRRRLRRIDNRRAATRSVSARRVSSGSAAARGVASGRASTRSIASRSVSARRVAPGSISGRRSRSTALRRGRATASGCRIARGAGARRCVARGGLVHHLAATCRGNAGPRSGDANSRRNGCGRAGRDAGDRADRHAWRAGRCIGSESNRTRRAADYARR